MSLVMSCVVPITIFVFTCPLPLLDPAPPLGPNFGLGVAVLFGGLLTYNSAQWLPMLRKQDPRRLAP